MVRHVLYTAVGICITAGALYAYQQVRFGERTVVFFRMVFADESELGTFRGRGNLERRRDFTTDSGGRREFLQDSTARPPRSQREGRRSRPPQQRGEGMTPPVGPTDERRSRPPQDEGREERRARFSAELAGRRGGRGRGPAVALEEVGYYTLILSFVVMVTYLVDGIARKATRAWQARRRGSHVAVTAPTKHT